MKAAEIKEIYSKIAPDYNHLVMKEARYTAYKRVAQCVNRNLAPGSRVLDLGCGTGISSLELFKKGHQVTGIDIAPGMISEAKKLPFEKLYCQDIEKPLRPKGKFDAIMLVGVMEFIHHPLPLFKRIRRSLQAGGVLALTIPKRVLKSSKLGIHSYTRKEVEALFREAGFEIVSVDEFFGYEKRGERVQYYAYLLKI